MTISKEVWDKMCPKTNPFLKFEYVNALLQSHSIGEEVGWEPILLTDEEAGLITFKKMHSYGEYIFDWAWADAFERYGHRYYPKLTSMIPFTPVTTSHFLMKDFLYPRAQKLLDHHDQLLGEGPASSAHFLFLEHQEKEIFTNNGYILRESLQYHFFNQGHGSFGDFLKELKPKKAKTLKKERDIKGFKINRFTGVGLRQEHALEMFTFYQSTILEKHSFSYLNKAFFQLVFETMKENLLYVQATRGNKVIAGSLFFFDQEKLFGRYWGSIEYVPFLHFELCYYQGIDFCFEKGIKVFEAGAQGEHKIARGFRPTLIYSAHKIKDLSFHQAISDFIQKEKNLVSRRKMELESLLPFK